DSFRERYDARPSFSNKAADIVFNLHIMNNRATIALDILGLSMHQRGYRMLSVEAPLQETLAAAIVRIVGWNGEGVFLDPMCGSGTILAEALMRFCEIPAGYLRNNERIRHLPGFSSDEWHKTIESENAKIKPLGKGRIAGSDINPLAVEAARANLARLPGGANVELKALPFQKIHAQADRTVVCNPPYGIRLERGLGVQQVYRELGDFLKQKCPNSSAYILCGDKDLVKELRLRAHWTKSLKNADLETKLAKIIVRSQIGLNIQ
ncbi:MAG TPA: class I SAM-dependent RNA methyltransferase, partial [Candidatus Cloacimonadota bacterium]|nr:class I SAM-dependent RNA methyltransferase [Candidatus Cloacimonadota bacterium]